MNSDKFSRNGQTGVIQFRASISDFRSIPGNPIAYWISERMVFAFSNNQNLSSIFYSDGLTKTGNNDKFLRFHWEVDRESVIDTERYRICVKGGKRRNYYGNTNVIVNWLPETRGHYRHDNVARITPDYLWQKAGISWTKMSSDEPSFRWLSEGMIAETAGPAIFLKDHLDDSILFQALGFLSSNVCLDLLRALNSTMSFQTNDVLRLPAIFNKTQKSTVIVKNLINKHKTDWNSIETSLEFSSLTVLQSSCQAVAVSDIYSKLRSHWLEDTLETQRLEEENNRIFIEAYDLQDELAAEVPLSEITLTCNPHYRYKGNKTEAELEALLLADTMKEFISYAVGCMFGRYSLDKPGLILANQGETIEDYIAQIPSPSFSADDDNVIPILDGDWFSDDVTERFFKFLRVTFGDEHYEENLQFIENAIGKSIRKYFLKDFYNDHVRRYKKRPIYWMFSSPKGSFNVLIYMHRYQPDTVSIILNGYLREFRAKLNAKLAHLEKVGIGSDSSKSEKAKAIKEIEKLKKIITEVEDYERDVLYPLATKQVKIDLDDGVKVNYKKFGKALRKITGLTK